MADERVTMVDRGRLDELRNGLRKALALAAVVARLTPTAADDVAVSVLQAIVDSERLDAVLDLIGR